MAQERCSRLSAVSSLNPSRHFVDARHGYRKQPTSPFLDAMAGPLLGHLDRFPQQVLAFVQQRSDLCMKEDAIIMDCPICLLQALPFDLARPFFFLRKTVFVWKTVFLENRVW